MKGEPLYQLGPGIDENEEWMVVKRFARTSKNKNKSIVKLVHKKTGTDHCTHPLDASHLKRWLETVKLVDQSLCPLCERQNPVRRRRRRNVSSRTVNGIEEPFEEEPGADFLRDCINDRYKPIPNPPQGIVHIATSRIPNTGDGIFTDVELLRDEDASALGTYGGKVIYKQKEVEESKSDKIMSFDLWNNVIHVDAESSWNGKINQQWDWPYDLLSDEELRVKGLKRIEPDPRWLRAFSNIDISPDGTIFPNRDIDLGEELTINYGLDFWKDKKFKPTWNLESIENVFARVELEQALSKDPLLKEIYEASTILFGGEEEVTGEEEEEGEEEEGMSI